MTNVKNVLICPDCGQENLQGEEECSSCSAPLVNFDKSPDRMGMSTISRDRIRELTLSPVKTLNHADSVRQAVQAMAEQRDACIMVVTDGKLSGIITERDVLYKLAGSDLANDTRTLDDIMTKDPVRVYTDDRVASAFNKMAVGGYRHLPVFDGERLTGMITVTTLLAYLHDHNPNREATAREQNQT